MEVIGNKTKEQRENEIAQLQDLQNHAGWKLFKANVDYNIELVKEAILNGVEGETPETVTRLRDKLKVHQAIIESPDKMIEGLRLIVTVPENDDPY